MDSNLILIIVSFALVGAIVSMLAIYLKQEKKLLQLLHDDYHRGKKHSHA
jgi:hypothetical protein